MTHISVDVGGRGNLTAGELAGKKRVQKYHVLQNSSDLRVHDRATTFRVAK
jgi:hypothetical protein